ncbi:MAG: hypothetical protein V4655_10325 [Bdellovibrionota bacterium]|nr:MAG: hypothetical protein EOP10_12235 [Pseudomonadota bacterium]
MGKETKIGKTKVVNFDDLNFGAVDLKAETPEGQSAEADIQPSSLQFRIDHNQFSRGKKWDATRISKYVTVLLLALFLTSMTLRYMDDLREDAIIEVKKLVTKVRKKKLAKIVVPVLGQVSLALKAHRPLNAPVNFDTAVANPQTSCSTYISESINKKLKSKLTPEEQIHVVNCQLFQDSVEVARQTLEKGGFNLNEVSWKKIYPNLLSLHTLRRSQPLQPLAILAKQGCLRWAPSADCLLRYVDESHLSFKSRWVDGFKILEKVVADQPPEVNAWFYLASGSYASRDSEYGKAGEFFKTAQEKLTLISDPLLQREIYRGAMINAYLSSDAQLFAQADALRPLNRVEEDPRAFLDVDLLKQLRGESAREDLLSYFLAPEARKRFVYNARFLSILFRASQFLNAPDEGAAFAAVVLGKDPSPEVLGESLVMQYARLQIARKKGPEAMALLGKLERAGYRSPELYHMKGLAQLYVKGKSSAMMAAKEFQTSAGISKNEDSLFAMTVTLLGSDNLGKAEQVLAQWRTLGPNAQKTSWFYLAEGLVQSQSGKGAEAMVTWAKGEKLGKYSEMWKILKANLQSDPTFLDRDLVGNLRYMMPVDSPLGSLALSVHKS